jgi:hypothetical protein
MYEFKIGPDLETLEAGIEYIIVRKDEFNAYKNCSKDYKEKCPDVKCWVQTLRDKQMNIIANFEATVERQEKTIESQGREASRRHEFLCEVKEVLDKYFKEDV